ncbi:helix-turn-helix transcriptional regulator [Aquimarina sp. RZ0]|uniref:helix-turn-helix transcriptional regulator n=1 Tax=Aquimarina sp. RZ0 TaxID=2607730 RepID=UPI0034CF91B2
MEINRIKVALAETRRKNKWLAEQIGKDESTISQWCTNARQPSLENLLKIAKILDIDIRELLYSTKNSTD